MRRNFPDPTDGSAGDPLYGQMITPRGPPALGVIGKGVVAPTGVVGLTALAPAAVPVGRSRNQRLAPAWHKPRRRYLQREMSPDFVLAMQDDCFSALNGSPGNRLWFGHVKLHEGAPPP